MYKIIQYTFFILLFFKTDLGYSQITCSDLFNTKTQNQFLKSLKINENLMRELGYTIKDNTTLYKKNIKIGTVVSMKPKYFFEWKKQSLHEYWVKNGKYSKADMDRVLALPEQSYGRGFYVSLDPTDSTNYGSHLTVFKVDREILLFKPDNYDLYQDESITFDLRAIGFAGYDCQTASWLNIFNEKFLNKAVPIDKKIFQEIKEDSEYQAKKLLKKPSIRQLVR